MSGNLSASAQKRMGLPEGFKPYSSFPFKGLNQSSSREAMEDSELFWLENFIRTGDGELRSLWDAGTPLYTVPPGKTIVSFFWFNIGQADYAIVFLSDGTAVQVSYPGGDQTVVSATSGLFYLAGKTLPACCQSGSQYLLICNHNTQNDYWIWDGKVLYSAGSIGPTVAGTIIDGGTGYTSVPGYTVFDGTGSGVVLTPVISEGSVVALAVDNPGHGYSPGDIVQVAFEGGGSDNTPILTASLTGGSIGHITLIGGGTGYAIGTYNLTFSGGGGSGAAGIYSVTSVGGPVVGIVLTNSGSGYTTAPSIAFPSGGGSGAAAEAFINQSGVASITVVDGGTNLSGTPVLTIIGGGGTGATATATVSGGTITSVTVNNPGAGYETAPAVEVQTALNNAAAAILQLMPFGVSGTTLETYQSRVWIAYPHQVALEQNGGIFFVSAPFSLTDFATSAGGDLFTNTDRFLRKQYTFLRQTSNFLYATGDSSVSVISNVQTAGNPATTTFSYQNADPQVGTSWRDTAQDFGSTILFGNPLGVYGIYGGTARKISGKIDKLFTNAVLPGAGGLTPTGAVANIYSQKAYLFLMTITDPFTNRARNVMLGWDEKEWFVASQSPALKYIATQEINSNLAAWGTDGTSLYPLLATPSASLVKSISTKQWGGAISFTIKMSHSVYVDAENLSVGQEDLAFHGSIDAVGLAIPHLNYVTQQLLSCPSISLPFANQHGTPTAVTMQAPRGQGSMLGFGSGNGMPQVPGVALGVTLASSNPDFVLRNVTLGTLDQTAVA